MIYGSSRLGLWKSDVDLLSYIPEVPEVLVVDRGNKRYEMNDHLSNVHAVVTDRRKRICEEETFSHYEADIQTTYDYYAFGMMMPGRTFSAAIDSIPCVPDTQVVADTLYALDFGSSTESFTSIFGATLSNTGGALQVGKTTCPFRGACENYGAARAISLADMQTYTVSFDLDKGSCTNDISVLFKDASGNAVSTTHYAGSGSHSFSFTPTVDVATFEIRMVANEGCQFSLDNLLITRMDTLIIPCDTSGTGGMGNNLLASGYRFGFNGQEKDNEVYGEGNAYTAEFWEYDPRIGRRWNLDPVDQIRISNYAAFGNNPILFSDPKGDTFDVGTDEKSQKDVRSTVKDKNQQYLDIDSKTGRASLNFGDMAKKDIEKILNRDEGLSLINDMVSSDKKMLYEASDLALVKNENGENWGFPMVSDPNYTINASNNGKDSNGGYTVRPKDGYDGQVIMHPEVTFQDGSGGKVFRNSIVFHELAENYARTELGLDYHDSKGGVQGAHSYSKDREQMWWGISSRMPGHAVPVPLPKLTRERADRIFKIINQYMYAK